MNTIWCIQQGSAAPIVYTTMSLSLSLSSSHTASLTFFSTVFLTCSLTLPLLHITTTQLPSHFFLSLRLFLHLHLYALLSPPAPPLPLPLLLSGLCDSPVMVSLILIQRYNSQVANKVTCCSSKDIRFYDLYLWNCLLAWSESTVKPPGFNLKDTWYEQTIS